jgi:hypothetical protein
MDAEFLFAGGLAFLLALLGWSDQIRGAQEQTREQERAFLNAYQVSWADVRPLIRPSEQHSPEKQLAALLRILGSSILRQDEGADLLTKFQGLDDCRSRLEERLAIRYWLIFSTATTMLTGGLLLTLPADDSLNAAGEPLSIGALFVWLALVAVILIYTILIARDEVTFRHELGSIEDYFRSIQPLASPEDPTDGG